MARGCGLPGVRLQACGLARKSKRRPAGCARASLGPEGSRPPCLGPWNQFGQNASVRVRVFLSLPSPSPARAPKPCSKSQVGFFSPSGTKQWSRLSFSKTLTRWLFAAWERGGLLLHPPPLRPAQLWPPGVPRFQQPRTGPPKSPAARGASRKLQEAAALNPVASSAALLARPPLRSFWCH